MGDRLLESRKKTATCPSRSTGNQRVTTPPPPPPRRRKPKPVVYVYWSSKMETCFGRWLSGHQDSRDRKDRGKWDDHINKDNPPASSNMYPKGKDISHPRGRGSHFLPWRGGRHRSKGGGSSGLPIQPKRGKGEEQEHPSSQVTSASSLRSSRPIPPSQTSRTIKSKQQTWQKAGEEARTERRLDDEAVEQAEQAEIMGHPSMQMWRNHRSSSVPWSSQPVELAYHRTKEKRASTQEKGDTVMMVMDGSPSLERHRSYMYCYAEDGDDDDDDGPRLAGREALSRISACLPALHRVAWHRIASHRLSVIKSSRCPAIYLLLLWLAMAPSQAEKGKP
ncbi:hypothetical protein TEQG_05930 [Trichophyton equinum CBS 127.97]|uniref:Uncharacterized protein n=1 Tax=Trichophyton equinum (strain ATCC MYA-4606 / CBS 127.97) TaxID=559882 RepID=F2PYA7_TRIEC|nr:hypothetical protein TEQG_05930 [Trichophyton equinum CBS 127.97]